MRGFTFLSASLIHADAVALAKTEEASAGPEGRSLREGEGDAE